MYKCKVVLQKQFGSLEWTTCCCCCCVLFIYFHQELKLKNLCVFWVSFSCCLKCRLCPVQLIDNHGRASGSSCGRNLFSLHISLVLVVVDVLTDFSFLPLHFIATGFGFSHHQILISFSLFPFFLLNSSEHRIRS